MGVTRYTDDNSFRPWAPEVIARVDTLGETLRLVEHTELRNQLLMISRLSPNRKHVA